MAVVVRPNNVLEHFFASAEQDLRRRLGRAHLGRDMGYLEGAGPYSTLERMYKRRSRIEILSWAHSCNQRMRSWAQEHGVVVPLDDSYESITFTEPSHPGHELAPERRSSELELSRRPMA